MDWDKSSPAAVKASCTSVCVCVCVTLLAEKSFKGKIGLRKPGGAGLGALGPAGARAIFAKKRTCSAGVVPRNVIQMHCGPCDDVLDLERNGLTRRRGFVKEKASSATVMKPHQEWGAQNHPTNCRSSFDADFFPKGT